MLLHLCRVYPGGTAWDRVCGLFTIHIHYVCGSQQELSLTLWLQHLTACTVQHIRSIALLVLPCYYTFKYTYCPLIYVRIITIISTTLTYPRDFYTYAI